jgi:hypothetical protein
MATYKGASASPTSPPIDWWNDDVDGQRESAAFSALTALRSLQSSRVYAGLLYEATYEQRNMFSSEMASPTIFPAMGFGPWSARGEVNLLTYNAMQIGFDTLVSKLTQADAQVKFLTDGGNWESRKKAEQLEKLVKGEFYRLDFYAVKENIELDMLLHGRGYLKFYVDPDTKAPSCERVHPLDVFFDELEARDNPPQTMYQVRIVSKSSLKAQYPELAVEIDDAQLTGNSEIYSTRGMNPTQMVEILECWRIPSCKGGDDGRHGLFIPTAVLSYDHWTRDDFPFATMTWTERRRGPYPLSAAEQIIFLQRNLNRLIQRKHECIYTLSAPYILSSETQALNPAQFTTDGVGNFITYQHDGAEKPHIEVQKVVPDDIEMAIASLKREIAEVLGLTGLESMGEKPQGLESAPALQEYTEQSSLRHVKTLKENERFVLRAAKQLLTTIREVKEEYGDYVAFGQGRGEVEEIKFSAADLPPNAYMAQMAAANLLPQTPAGRLNKIVQLAGTGAFSPKQIIRAFQSPDINAITADVTSTEEDIDWTIYEMCKQGGRYLPPDEHQDLETGIERVNDAYLSERRKNAPSEVLERLDRWVAEALVKRQQMQQAQMMQAMAQQNPMVAPPGGAPGGESGLSQPGVPSQAPEGLTGGTPMGQ